jgi:hypothetical protein
MAKTVSAGRTKLNGKTITIAVAVLIIAVVVVGAFSVLGHAKGPSKAQAAEEGKRALEKAAEIVNSGKAAGTQARSDGSSTDKTTN